MHKVLCHVSSMSAALAPSTHKPGSRLNRDANQVGFGFDSRARLGWPGVGKRI
jgi:hypothetical protein